MATFSSAVLEAEQSEARAKEVGRRRSGVSGGGRARRGGRGGSLRQQSDGGPAQAEKNRSPNRQQARGAAAVWNPQIHEGEQRLNCTRVPGYLSPEGLNG
uniref:Uncharacterized protein n=1 Tax=Oryza barthii TaxID=65489 RepID=A0A0D3H0U4_9ORYZ